MVLTLGLVVIGCGDILTAVNLACSGGYFAVALGMMVSGAGTGLLSGETTKAMISAVPPERAGMAGGLTGTTRFVGIVAGISVLGALAQRAAAGTGSAASAGGLPTLTSSPMRPCSWRLRCRLPSRLSHRVSPRSLFLFRGLFTRVARKETALYVRSAIMPILSEVAPYDFRP
jgi:hypothetical protein